MLDTILGAEPGGVGKGPIMLVVKTKLLDRVCWQVSSLQDHGGVIGLPTMSAVKEGRPSAYSSSVGLQECIPKQPGLLQQCSNRLAAARNAQLEMLA